MIEITRYLKNLLYIRLFNEKKLLINFYNSKSKILQNFFLSSHT